MMFSRAFTNHLTGVPFYNGIPTGSARGRGSP
jgi:hypothetical protein